MGRRRRRRRRRGSRHTAISASSCLWRETSCGCTRRRGRFGRPGGQIYIQTSAAHLGSRGGAVSVYLFDIVLRALCAKAWEGAERSEGMRGVLLGEEGLREAGSEDVYVEDMYLSSRTLVGW